MMVSDVASNKPWQLKSYRGFAPDVDFEAPIVQEMPVQSIVCNPPQNTVIGMKGATELEVGGVAWSGGGKKIFCADVSLDGGKHFTASELYKPIEQRRNRDWAWTQFHKKLTLPDDVKAKLNKGEKVEVTICSKAINFDFNIQPETMDPYWNARGVCINNWYRVKVVLDPNLAEGTINRADTPYEFGNTPSEGKFKDP